MMFGARLGIEMSQLDAVNKTRQGYCDDCFVDVFDIWRKNSTSQNYEPFTWSSAIKVLFSCSFDDYKDSNKDVAGDIFVHFSPE